MSISNTRCLDVVVGDEVVVAIDWQGASVWAHGK